MFGFIKKLFGFGTAETAATPVAPYKVEAPVNTQITDSVTTKPVAVKLRQPGTPKQGAKKPAQGKNPAAKKPQGPKPAGQKKPAQPKPQSGQKPAGNKPRGRKPKPATPQQ